MRVKEKAPGIADSPRMETIESKNATPFEAKAAPPSPKRTLVYSCSGCSDAGELADRTARALSAQGVAEMSCLAGIGGRVKNLMTKAERADEILVMDGCPLNCARKTLELAGFNKFRRLELHRLGVRKGSCPVTAEKIAMATKAAIAMIAPGSNLNQNELMAVNSISAPLAMVGGIE